MSRINKKRIYLFLIQYCSSIVLCLGFPFLTNAQSFTNGSFTNGSANWVTTGNFQCVNSGYTNYRTAPGYAFFAAADGQIGDSNSITGTLSQSLDLPANFSGGTIQFYTEITTQETTTTSKYDIMTYTVTDGTTGSNVQMALSNLDASAGYVLQTLNVPAGMAGHNVTFTFYASNDGAKGTVFRIDDVTFTSGTSGVGQNLTVTVTNVNGAARDNAEVKLYNSNFTAVLQTLTTNSAGQVTFQNLANGGYNYEVRYTPSITNSPISSNTEFWGDGSATLNGSSVNQTFNRIQPYISGTGNFAPANLIQNQSTAGFFSLKNALAYNARSYLAVWVDRDELSPWDSNLGTSAGASLITAGSAADFPVNVSPNALGDYNIYAAVYTDVNNNGNYILTDQYNWTYAFSVNPATIQWSGLTWDLTNGGPVNPGGNLWSGNTRNVWVDAQQNLHIKITKVGNGWYCPQLALDHSIGYGEYRFLVNSRIDQLDQNVVFAMYNYEGLPANNTPQEYEMDIEYSLWSGAYPSKNADFVVQYRKSPQDGGGSTVIAPQRFLATLNSNLSTHIFNWNAGTVTFQSYNNHYTGTPNSADLISQYVVNDSRVPPADKEKPIINLWLNNGVPPSNQQEVEVVLQSFTFTPAGTVACTTPTTAPTSTYGSADCSSPAVLNGTQASLTFTGDGATIYQASVSKYPYGTVNVIYTAPCQSSAAAFNTPGLTPGMLYRWNMYGYGATDCTSCQSPLSQSLYFGIPAAISTTGYTAGNGTQAILSTQPQVAGDGGQVTYKWLKDAQIVAQGAGLTSYTATAPGTYSLIISYSGSSVCSDTTSTFPSNAITINLAGPGCTPSVAPSSISATPTGDGTGSYLLSLNGGTLGTNASWNWYTGGCGAALYQHDTDHIVVNPATPTLYYLRAEGDCGTANCDSILVTGSGGCVSSTLPDSITVTKNGNSYFLDVSKGQLAPGAQWVLYTNTCCNVPAAENTTGIFSVNPASVTTYDIRAEGCSTSGTLTTTINGGNCISSIAPDSLSQEALTGANNAASTVITIDGGYLAPQDSWHWYTGSLTNLVQYTTSTSSSILVTPGTLTTFLVRAEGCDTTAFTEINVFPPCQSVAPSSIGVVRHGTAPGSEVDLVQQGGELRSLESWTWYKGSCGGIELQGGLSDTLKDYPKVTTTYYVRAAGGCTPAACDSVTVVVVTLPTVTAFSPVSAIIGTEVSITGTNFDQSSQVSFGSVAAQSVILNSATSITAVVGKGATGDVSVTTSAGTASLSGFQYQLTLPDTNFQIIATGLSCRGSNNGTIQIKAADQSYSYHVTVTGNGTNADAGFNTVFEQPNLSAGTYAVCITVVGDTSYSLCDSVVVTQPLPLSMFTFVEAAGDSVLVNLSGSSEYKLMLNGIAYTITANAAMLPLKDGDNDLILSSAIACQGVIEKHISIPPHYVPYPDPFTDVINLNFGTTVFQTVSIAITNVAGGKAVFEQQSSQVSGILQLDLRQLGTGVYALQLTAGKLTKVFKIIKR